MKPINISRYVVLIMIIILNTNCTKEGSSFNTNNSPSLFPPPPPPPTSNTAPNCNAGLDIRILFPTNFYTLYGVANDGENNIQTFSWSKVSGPSSFLIEHPDSLKTKVSNLQVGIYYFELAVSDSGGLSGKDTIKVTVDSVIYNNNEVIFENQIWGTEGLTTTLLWGSAIIIHNVYQFLPAYGTPFTVYIKRYNSTNWEELKMDDYNTSLFTSLLNGNILFIYSNYEETDTPSIKLVY